MKRWWLDSWPCRWLDDAYRDFIRVFTGGSYTEEGSPSALVIPYLEMQQSFPLGRRTSSAASKLDPILCELVPQRHEQAFREIQLRMLQWKRQQLRHPKGLRWFLPQWHPAYLINPEMIMRWQTIFEVWYILCVVWESTYPTTSPMYVSYERDTS